MGNKGRGGELMSFVRFSNAGSENAGTLGVSGLRTVLDGRRLRGAAALGAAVACSATSAMGKTRENIIKYAKYT